MASPPIRGCLGGGSKRKWTALVLSEPAVSSVLAHMGEQTVAGLEDHSVGGGEAAAKEGGGMKFRGLDSGGRGGVEKESL